MAYFRRKQVKKGPKRAVRAGGRRLQPSLGAVAGVAVAKRIYTNRVRRNKAYAFKAKTAYQTRLEASDNIITGPAMRIGKQKVLSFNEKVARVARPPMLFKRNYQFNVECSSGRKCFFYYDFNSMSANDLLGDITTYKSSLLTNTASVDPTVSLANAGDASKFYVDSLRETIRMINSSSNALKGKCHLIGYKRDSDNNYQGTNTPITPVNMMAYYSANGGLTALVPGQEATVGNGWNFNTTTTGSNYQQALNMPGSSLHPTAVGLQTDPQLNLFSPHIKERMNFWFKNVKTTEFSLKPGQEFDQNLVFNDLRKIHREEQEYIHLAGVTFALVVEFQGQIVGDNGETGGLITSGSCQLSCIRESTRTLGLVNPLRSQVLLQTAPLSIIPLNVQYIINPDTGVADVGVDQDA